MKKHLSLALLPFLALATACSESEAKDLMGKAQEATSELDLSSLSAEGMKDTVSDLSAKASEQLSRITDKASAIDVSEKLGPMVDQLSKLKGMLGDKLPNLDGLGTAITDFKAKFADNEAVMKVIEPLLEKLQGLVK